MTDPQRPRTERHPFVPGGALSTTCARSDCWQAPDAAIHRAVRAATLAAPAGLREALDELSKEAAINRVGSDPSAAPYALGIDRAMSIIRAALEAAPRSPEPPRLDPLDIDAMAFALEARDVQRGGSPHITPGNTFYREAAGALLALLPPRADRALEAASHG